MFLKRGQSAFNLYEIIAHSYDGIPLDLSKSKNLCTSYSTGYHVKQPRKLKKSERKPLVTSINELKSIARLEKQERCVVREVALRPPENGLLVKRLVPVANQVLAARAELYACVSRVVDTVPVYSCSLCEEAHVGYPPHKIRTCDGTGSRASKEHTWERGGIDHILPVVESFHLYDRLERAVSHNERLQVDRIPAILELCIQAGVDICEYPTRRRQFPVYNVAGRMIDFERRFPKDNSSDINASGFWEYRKKPSEDKKNLSFPYDDMLGFAVRGMEAWEKMCSGAIRLMEKYAVQTCGYCPEVQVGPKGHRVRQCQAFKHQMRDGQHAWQAATIDDLFPPVYVWHVRNPQICEPMVDALKSYYGKMPAVVELFTQAGARTSENYSEVMREDVAVPGLDERMWVI